MFLAFPDMYTENVLIMDDAINIIFFIDIIVNFMSAHYDSDYTIIDDRKEIAMRYLESWFFFDFISVVPFDLFFTFGNMNRIARFTRIGKLYKIIRVLKIIRLFKIIKINDKVTKHLTKLLKINAGIERLCYLLLIFFII